MRKLVFWILVSALVMLILPWLAVSFVKGDNGMAVCFILFYLGNPIYSLLAGVYAGKDRKDRKDLWIVPIITAVLFLAGAWSIFDKNETVFVLYALIYLLLGIAAMFVSGFKKKS